MAGDAAECRFLRGPPPGIPRGSAGIRLIGRTCQRPPDFGRVSLQRVVDPASPFLHRVSPDGIPLLHRYYGMLRGPAARLAALRCLRLAIPRLRRCCSCPATGRSRRPASHGRWAWGLLCRLPHSGSQRGDDRDSQVPGEPQCGRALLFDPDGTGRTRPLQPGRCCLPQSQRRRLPRR